jgi:hypothetical protein
MKKSELNWKTGIVTLWEIDDLDLTQNVDSQIELLKEDLVHASFGASVVLDLGWYPEFSLRGQFGLVIVKLTNEKDFGHDWANPILELRFSDITRLAHKLNEAIEVAQRIASESD